MSNKIICSVTVAVLILPWPVLFSGCKEKQEARPAPPPEVEVVAVGQRDVPIYREWVGTLEGDVNATISAQVSGYLLTRNYVEGSMVTNGQVLFQIDPAPFKATLDKAKAQLTQAQAQKLKYALDVSATRRWRKRRPSANRNSTTRSRMRQRPKARSKPPRRPSSRRR